MNIPHDQMSHSSAHLTHRSLMPELVSPLLHSSTTSKQEQKTPVRCPWVRSLTQLPVAVTHSPAEMVAAWPTRVTSSRWPRALTRTVDVAGLLCTCVAGIGQHNSADTDQSQYEFLHSPGA